MFTSSLWKALGVVVTLLAMRASGGRDLIDMEWERYAERVKILHKLLMTDCPGQALAVPVVKPLKRDLLSTVQATSARLRVERLLYEQMIRVYIGYRSKPTESGHVSTTTTSRTTTTAPRTTSTPHTTTTPSMSSTTPPTTKSPVPLECESAKNLTDGWRKELKRNGRNCDVRDMAKDGKPWFRFTGAAGNRMLDTCPPPHSCNTNVAMWTDELLPVKVGLASTIRVYGSYTSGGCKSYEYIVSTMRCSNDTSYDVIYRYERKTSGPYECYAGFCSTD